MSLPLLRFEALHLPKLWGSEDWQLYQRPDRSAVVAEGPLRGQTLRQLVEELGPRFLGDKLYGRGAKAFPLMLKRITARQDLSVQVHPDDAQAAAMVGPDEPGKSEMWVVLEAQPGARVAAGLKPGVDRAAFARALKEGKVEALLATTPVAAGDVIDLPAGRVHAIGAGCVMAEVQQNSDTTYRVWDYGRLEGGQPRQLHVDEALRVINFDPAFAALPPKASPRPLGGGRELLVANAHFIVERVQVRERFTPPSREPAPELLLALEGSGWLQGPEGQRVALKAGDFWLAPAHTPWAGESAQGLGLLWARPALQG